MRRKLIIASIVLASITAAIIGQKLFHTMRVADSEVQETAVSAISNDRPPMGAQLPSEPPIDAAELARLNREAAEDTKASAALEAEFKADGWKFVESEAPDEKLIRLDPSLLGEHERALTEQIRTNSYSAESVDSLRIIAIAAKDEETKTAATEAIGRINDPAAQSALIDIYRNSSNRELRSQILGILRPTKDDDVSKFLIEQIASNDNEDATKRAASFPLAISILLTGDEEMIAEIAEKLPIDSRDDFLALLENVRRGGGPR